MGLETFPEIESFQKLPHRVIVKGGQSSYSQQDGAELRGIVINNIGHGVKELTVHLVVFDENKIPVYNTSMMPDNSHLPQGGIATFMFRLKDYPTVISDYHLYTNWNFDD